MGTIMRNNPNISSNTLEAFARRVRVPVLVAGVILIGVMLTAVGVHILLPVSPIAMYLIRVGRGGLFMFPFIYVILGTYYGRVQKDQIDRTDLPILELSAVTKLIFSAIRSVTSQIMSAVASGTCTACTSSQGAQTHLLVSAPAQRETHTRPPRLRVGRPTSSKEAGHARLSSRTSTSAVTIARAGGARP